MGRGRGKQRGGGLCFCSRLAKNKALKDALGFCDGLVGWAVPGGQEGAETWCDVALTVCLPPNVCGLICVWG